MLVRDAQHILKPWHDDSATDSMDSEAPDRGAPNMLLKVCTRNISGFSFAEAVSPVHPKQVRD
jgi:hypothetical protein